MTEPQPLRTLESAARTRLLGRQMGNRLAAALQGAAERQITPWLVQLSGEVGSGKTTFAQGFVAGMGYRGQVTSPTYSLASHYPLPHCDCWHLDLYRLRSAGSLSLLGLDDMLGQPRCVMLVEWLENAAEALPDPDARIVLSHSANCGRKVRYHCCSQRAQRLWSSL